MLAVGVDDARRVEEAPPLPVGVEADPLARARQEADHGRDLHELLEVDHGVVAAPADLAEGRGERGEEARERSDVHPERLSHGEPTPRTLAINRLDDSFSASAALAGRELYLRGERFLYCIAEE